MAINDGGPAFPQTNEQRYADPIHGVVRPSDIYGAADPGMSLRDYFAGQAISGVGGWPATGLGPSRSLKEATAFAYKIADAMLAARGKGTPDLLPLVREALQIVTELQSAGLDRHVIDLRDWEKSARAAIAQVEGR